MGARAPAPYPETTAAAGPPHGQRVAEPQGLRQPADVIGWRHGAQKKVPDNIKTGEGEATQKRGQAEIAKTERLATELLVTLARNAAPTAEALHLAIKGSVHDLLETAR